MRTSSSGSGMMPSGSASHPDPPPGLGSGAQDCEAVAYLWLGTFNCGIDQKMLAVACLWLGTFDCSVFLPARGCLALLRLPT